MKGGVCSSLVAAADKAGVFRHPPQRVRSFPATPCTLFSEAEPFKAGLHVAGRQERLRNAVNQSPGRDLRLDGLAVMQKSSGE